ncbi:hypothetical protein FRC01_005490 [Tulasnella sp. 417]|nr:hypothetical protein FRC01_005490 [Tulasnella sp. 417]
MDHQDQNPVFQEGDPIQQPIIQDDTFNQAPVDPVPVLDPTVQQLAQLFNEILNVQSASLRTHQTDLAVFTNEIVNRLDSLVGATQDNGTTDGAAPKTSVRVADPGNFSGKPIEARAFASKIDIALQFQPSINTSYLKCLYFGQHLTGPQYTWFDNHHRVYQTSQGHPLHIFNNYAVFRQEFLNRWADPDPRLTARLALNKLQQTRDVASYAATYETHVADMDMDPYTKAETFYRGLKEEIKDLLVIEGKPSDLSSMINKAQQIEARIRERAMEKKEAISRYRAQFNVHPAPGTSTIVAVPTADPNAMEVDATIFSPLPPRWESFSVNPAGANRAASSFKKLTPEEKQHRLRHGLCLYCGQAGHTVHEHKQQRINNAKSFNTATARPVNVSAATLSVEGKDGPQAI